LDFKKVTYHYLTEYINDVEHLMKSLNTRVMKSLNEVWPKPTSLSDLQKLLDECIHFESLSELIFTMLIDVKPWLALHDGQMLFECRDVNDAISDMEYFILSWEDILEMPFTAPAQVDSQRFVEGLAKIRTRSDTYSIMINTLDHFLGRILWIRNEAETKEAGNDVAHLTEDPGLKAMKHKIEWILRFVLGK
jgi:hypothetical protein